MQPDETLSHIALKYYGNATRPYWEVIHAANIETIPNAGMIKPGQVLNIPELPEELKKSRELNLWRSLRVSILQICLVLSPRN